MAEAMTEAITLIVMSLPKPCIKDAIYQVRRRLASAFVVARAAGMNSRRGIES